MGWSGDTPIRTRDSRLTISPFCHGLLAPSASVAVTAPGRRPACTQWRLARSWMYRPWCCPRSLAASVGLTQLDLQHVVCVPVASLGILAPGHPGPLAARVVLLLFLRLEVAVVLLEKRAGNIDAAVIRPLGETPRETCRPSSRSSLLAPRAAVWSRHERRCSLRLRESLYGSDECDGFRDRRRE